MSEVEVCERGVGFGGTRTGNRAEAVHQLCLHGDLGDARIAAGKAVLLHRVVHTPQVTRETPAVVGFVWSPPVGAEDEHFVLAVVTTGIEIGAEAGRGGGEREEEKEECCQQHEAGGGAHCCGEWCRLGSLDGHRRAVMD